MRIAIIGTGYVGLVAGTGFAENGHQVHCIDIDQARIEALSNGQLPIYEPGLKELLVRNLEGERLRFSTDLDEAVDGALLVFLCVGTPEGESGRVDLRDLMEAVKAVAAALTGYAAVVIKSTCPVGTAEQVRVCIAEHTSHPFDVVTNPEFLKEGAAVDDFMRPDRVVLGCDDVRVFEIMKELYGPFLRTGKPLIRLSLRSAELAKYAVNTMLAARISLMNEFANLAEACGADINEVRQVVMADSRIGPAYLFPGLGFGGSCMSKDISALHALAREHGIPTPIVEGINATNRTQRKAFAQRIVDFFDGGISGKKIALWGASFKARTDDIRDAPALDIIDLLLELDARVTVYDPHAGPALKDRYGDRIARATKMYDALDGVHALVITTEWREFHNPDFERVAEAMAEKVIFDGRNLYEPKAMARNGFRYLSVGRAGV